MSDSTKIHATHLNLSAYVYLQRSSPYQVEHNRESTERQYALVTKATALGWPSQQVVIIDDDPLSGTGIVERNGFAPLTAEVALGHVGIVLGLEVSHLNNPNVMYEIGYAQAAGMPLALLAEKVRSCRPMRWSEESCA